MNVRKSTDELPEEINPDFIFSGISNFLLSQAALGKIDLLNLAKKQLANRGLDAAGSWIGFEKAKQIHGVK